MRRKNTRRLVIHRSERPDEARTAYHFYIKRNGGMLDCLPLEDKGSHAKNFNGDSVAIAVEGCFCSGIRAKNNQVTAEQLITLHDLLLDLCGCYNLRASDIFGHSELGPGGTSDATKLVPATSCPGDLFPLDAVRAEVDRILTQNKESK